MADAKKYYYMRLNESYFDSDDQILLEAMPDGYLYSNILLKLYLKSLKRDGLLMFSDRIPYNSQMIATVTRHSVGTVEKALEIFQRLGIIEVMDSGAIYMTEVQNFVGKTSTEADRKRIYRSRIESEKSLPDTCFVTNAPNKVCECAANVPDAPYKCTTNVQDTVDKCPTNVRDTSDICTPEIEIETKNRDIYTSSSGHNNEGQETRGTHQSQAIDGEREQSQTRKTERGKTKEPPGMYDTHSKAGTTSYPSPTSAPPLPKQTKCDERFDQFWKMYPRKIGKGAARKAFAKINPDDELLKRMITAVVKQSKTTDWTKEGGQYIPHPTTWLNQERWEDEVAAAPSPNKGVPYGYDKWIL